MPITMGGMFSGLPPNLVDTIMQSERIPIRNMESKKGNIESKLNLVSDLDARVKSIKNSFRELLGTRGFQDYGLNLSREGIVAGAVDPNQAKTGHWTIEVQKMPENAGTITNGFPDRDRTQVGVGYLKFDTPEGRQSVYINDTNNTLNGIVGAINNANVGVQASVVKDSDDADYPFKLILTGSDAGDANNIDFPTVYLLDGDHDFYFDSDREATNGVVKINGFPIEVDSKKLNDLIPGVTLELLSAEPGREVVVSVNEDFEVIKGKIADFVKSLNGVLGFIQQQNTMDENTDTSKTLGGDSMLRSVEMRLRSMLQGGSFSFGPGVNRLSLLGIEFNRSGTLNFNEEKFDKTLRSDPQGVLKFFRGDGKDQNSGFIAKLNSIVDQMTNPAFGVISNRKRGLENRIDRIDRSIENKERFLQRKETALRRKFSRLEETMGRLQGQQNQVAAAGALPTIG